MSCSWGSSVIALIHQLISLPLHVSQLGFSFHSRYVYFILNTPPLQLLVRRGRERPVKISVVFGIVRVGSRFQIVEKVVTIASILDPRAAAIVLHLPVPSRNVFMRRRGEVVELVDELNGASDQVGPHRVVEIARLMVEETKNNKVKAADVRNGKKKKREMKIARRNKW